MTEEKTVPELLVEIINDYRGFKRLYDPIALEVTLGKYHTKKNEQGCNIMPLTKKGFLFHCCIDQTIYLDSTCKTKMVNVKTKALEGLLINYNISSGICPSCLDEYKRNRYKE